MYDRFRWTGISARRNLLTQEYEPVQPYVLAALAQRAGCRTFVDVGANVGAYSMFATLVPTIERVFAFEANPAAATELRANVRLNGLEQRIVVETKAVSRECGTVRFGMVSAFSGANSVVDTSIHDRSDFHRQVEVESVSLDRYFAEPPPGPLCVKIDVEGHEAEVIAGAERLLRSSGAVIQLEGYSAEAESFRRLADLGFFKVTAVGPDHLVSNLQALRDPAEAIAAYEAAAQAMIDTNHRTKAVLVKRGDVGLQLTGRTAERARRLAKRLAGRHL
jgi:FkbM family methyltransferase